MSSEGSSPEYDFSLEKAGQLPHFDPDRIAEQAVWPTVNHLWRSDWRQDSYPGDDFVFPSRGIGFHERDVFNIVLSADCHGLGPADPEEDSEIELQHKAIVQFDKVAVGGLSDIIVHRAYKDKPDLMGSLGDGPLGLIAKTGIAYAFDTHGPAEINAFQSVEIHSGTVLWVSEKFDEDELEEMNSGIEEETDYDEYPYGDYEGDEIVLDVDRFHEHDINNIIEALSILGAPEHCIRSLNIIKGQPLAAEVKADE